jgi:hypothetical protein
MSPRVKTQSCILQAYYLVAILSFAEEGFLLLKKSMIAAIPRNAFFDGFLS